MKFFLIIFMFFLSLPIIAMDGEVQGNEPYPPSVQQLDRIDVYSPREGDPFIINLAMNYKSFALYEACLMKDYSSGERFAQKAISAYAGQRVLPENPNSWSIAQEHLVEVDRAYENLNFVLKRSSADTFPALTAEAQTKFDCWVEQATENNNQNHIAECRNRFYSAIHALNEKFDFMFIKNHEKKAKVKCKSKKCVKVAKKTQEKKEVASNNGEGLQILTPVEGCCGENPVSREEFDALKEEVAILRKMIEDLKTQFENIPVERTTEKAVITLPNMEAFEIFFDFDSAVIKKVYYDVLHRVAQLANGNQAITFLISGHTDTSGKNNYNQRLGQRRADSVKAFLIKHGANRNNLTIISKGETDLKLQTRDGVKEYQNRRVFIEKLPAK
ncbi:MAG: OmpA family protein [Alphaproteobacteria bacterium]|nr:MAG: hypothetical protein B6I23_02245 [Rickettsiaceae bacterium 4572_127]